MSDEQKTPGPCTLCGGPIAVVGTWVWGNNAEPFNHGRCCDDCNQRLVIPMRMRRLNEGRDPRAVETDMDSLDGNHRRH
jgi:hypothetical protein